MRKPYILIIALLVITFANAAFAEVPSVVSYQGKLMQSDGTPIPNGTYSVTFAIYSVPAGGESLWSETNPTVHVKGGLFAVLLRNVGADILDSPEMYLGIKVGEDDELTPRQRITSVATALRAGEADIAKTVPDGAITNSKIADNAVGTTKLQDASVTSQKLSDNSVSTTKVAEGAIGMSKLADGVVVTSKLADDSITPSKIVSDPSGLVKVSGGLITTTPTTDAHLFSMRIDTQPNSPVSLFEYRTPTASDGKHDRFCWYANHDANWINKRSLSLWMYPSDGLGGCCHGLLFIGMDPNTGGDYCHIDANLTVSGSKSAVVDTKDYGRRLLYAVEAPENRFVDEGVAVLQNGTARVVLDPVFLQTIEGEPIVHITPYGDSQIYVSEVGNDHFVVSTRPGEQDIRFAWRVSAFRKGYSGVRLEQSHQ